MMNEWRKVPFGEVLSEAVKNGIYKPKEFHGSGTRIVNMGELFGNDFISNQEMKRIQLDDVEKSRFLVRDGDLLFARRSLVLEGSGRCALVVKGSEEMTFESSIIRARPDQSIADSRFLFYSFRSPYLRAAMASIATQTAVSGIRGSDLAFVEVALPPLSIQRRIASILSSYDDLIENCERRIRVLDEMARALYREWFVLFRYPGHENTPLVDSPLGRIPKGWSAMDLGILETAGEAEFQTGPFGTQLRASDYSDEGVPVINVRNIGYGAIRPDKLEFLADDHAEKHARHQLAEGDIVFGRKGAVDRHVLIGPDERGWIQGSDCIRLRLQSKRVTAALLTFGFRETKHKEWMLRQCSGAATMASLNQDVLRRIPLIIPNSAVLSAFDKFASSVLSDMRTLRRQSENLRKTRDLLLPRLLSGQLPVEDRHEKQLEESP